jgi:outer membrane receptor protein involved in Fe transport
VVQARLWKAARPSRRVGVEWTNQYKVLPWMTLDFDFAYTRARFANFDPVGDYIPGAPALVASGGVTFGGDTGWFGALRARYFGPRALIEDDSIRSQQSLIFNARAGYKFDNGLRLQLDALNLFNAQTNQIEYFYRRDCRASRSAASRPSHSSRRTAYGSLDAGGKVLICSLLPERCALAKIGRAPREAILS